MQLRGRGKCAGSGEERRGEEEVEDEGASEVRGNEEQCRVLG